MYSLEKQFNISSLISLLQDSINLLCGSDFVKVQQKSDNLMIRLIVKVSHGIYCLFEVHIISSRPVLTL